MQCIQKQNTCYFSYKKRIIRSGRFISKHNNNAVGLLELVQHHLAYCACFGFRQCMRRWEADPFVHSAERIEMKILFGLYSKIRY